MPKKDGIKIWDSQSGRRANYTHPRIFIGGFEVTNLVRNVKVDLPRDELGTVHLEIVAVPIRFEDDCIFIGEYPDDEFMAEMVRIKLMREGVMDSKKGE